MNATAPGKARAAPDTAMHIPGSCVLVTGASAGIGAATARAMAGRGAARVLLLARTAPALEQVAAEVRGLGAQADVYPVDLADASAVASAFAQIEAGGHWPDIVINSAGAGRWLFTEETSPAEAAEMVAVPYLAAFYVCHHCLPAMLRRRRGHIVNVNSPVVRGGWPGAAGYTAARYALYGFTRALQLDLHGTGVQVSSVIPGKVASEYFARNAGVEARAPRVARIIPTLRPGQVAAAIVDAVERNRREVVLPWMLRAFFAVNAGLPWLMEWALLRTGWRRAAGA